MNITDIVSELNQNISGNLSSDQLPQGLESHQVASVASESVLSSLMSQAGSGNLSNIMEMFSGSETSADHSSIAEMSPVVAQQLSSKLGIDSNMASGIVSQIMPMIMNTFNNKAGSGGFDVQSIVSQFQNGGIGDAIQDLIGGGKGNSTNPGAGGILNMIKGLFGGK